ncbi:transmembrane protein 87A-like isoform X2 [Lampetra fluviatilis]
MAFRVPRAVPSLRVTPSPDLCLLLILLVVPCVLCGGPEPGKFRGDITKNSKYLFARKTMFNQTDVHIQVLKATCPEMSGTFTVQWILRSSHCYNEFANLKDISSEMYMGAEDKEVVPDSQASYLKGSATITCNNFHMPAVPMKTLSVKLANKPQEEEKEKSPSDRRKREDAQAKPAVEAAAPDPAKVGDTKDLAPKTEPGAEAAAPDTAQVGDKRDEVPKSNVVARTWKESPFLFIVSISPDDNSGDKQSKDWKFDVEVGMNGPHGYISATEYPLKIFYMAMCVVYTLYAALWLVCSACYWKELLRIQLWVGGVIFLGMLEKAMFVGEFQNIGTYGTSVRGAVMVAELVSALKRTLARMLVIIVSLGYGIVKPRLGAMLHRVVGVGMLYLVFCCVEAMLRASEDPSNSTVLTSAIVLAMIDTCIVWWIFVSLAQTMRTLRLRRNPVKLSLYRHFTNTLIFSVIASVVFIVWSTRKFRMVDCLSDWRELWVETSFWSLLFSVILLVIMFLWRPSANNQRYAYSPLIDDDDEDSLDQNVMTGDAYGTKMRGTRTEMNGQARSGASQDEDLTWVEENIPSSVADLALPALLDSDEPDRGAVDPVSKTRKL